ncbi:MAG: hypothetical protein HFI38_04510 [Lachnospiraceae bacterium]|nr:hypothetical protein [Lachnospiraceae bacterium]
MNSDIFSKAMSEISESYVDEAIRYKKKTRIPVWIKTGAAAACLAVVLAVGNMLIPFQGSAMITVHAQGADQEITAAGAVLMSGAIRDNGEMTGHPLSFYLSGKDIATVRFSCKNQQISFMDWTEKRDEYGNAGNFTVAYGEDESEYAYLMIDWVPVGIIRRLTDHADSTIETLPEEMRSDIIVMEITFADGKTATKAITISLLDDGTFFAAFDDYKISKEDTFVSRPDSEAIPRHILYSQGAAPTNTADDTPTEQTKWGVTLFVENVTSTGLTLICTQSGGLQTGRLQTGSFYKLMGWDSEAWHDVPYIIKEAAWTEEVFLIPSEDRIEWEIDWEYLYGELPAGTYRIIKRIDDFRKNGDFDSEECWAEFEIK